MGQNIQLRKFQSYTNDFHCKKIELFEISVLDLDKQKALLCK